MSDSCSCTETFFRPELDNGGGLWLNYSRLKSLPTADKICRAHCSSVKRIFAKRNLIEKVSETDVERFHNLIELYMPSNCLGTLPTNIGYLRSLVTLNLDGNKIRLLPYSISKLTSLSTLILRDNQLEELPDCIGSLSSLTFLDLSMNKLSIFPNAVLKCKSLKKLWMSQNHIQWLPPSLCMNESIEEINISSNNLVHLPADLGRSSTLASIRMSKNRYLKAIPGWLRNKLGFCIGSTSVRSCEDPSEHIGLKKISFKSEQLGQIDLMLPHGVEHGSEDEVDQVPMLQELVLQSLHALREKLKLSTMSKHASRILPKYPAAHCCRCGKPMFKRRLAVHSGFLTICHDDLLHVIDYFCSPFCIRAHRRDSIL